MKDACAADGHRLELDFSGATAAFATEVVPICALTLNWRLANPERAVELTLPVDPQLRTLFLNAGWANLMDPNSCPDVPAAGGLHIPATVYSTQDELHDLLDDVEVRVEREIDVADAGILQGIFWSLNEVTDNVMQHAEAPFGILQFSTMSKFISITVVDLGRGIYDSLKSGGLTWEGGVPGAIEHAVQIGVTRSQATNQGNGLAGSRAIARESDGSMWIWSGTGLWEDKYHGPGIRHPRRSIAPFGFPGTIVHLRIGTEKPYIIDALRELGMTQRPPFDYVERRFEPEDENVIRVSMRDELEGMRTRHHGNAFRRRLERWLKERPEFPIRLDWSDVTALPSSSFADEAFGKLLVDIGLTAYAQRIHHVGISPEAVAIVDGAVMRRMAQSFGNPPT